MDDPITLEDLVRFLESKKRSKKGNNMNSIKLHFYIGNDDGTTACDFRGEKAIGKDEGDEHKTLAEIDPADEQTVALCLAAGPEINKMLAKLDPAKALEGLLGKGAGLRIGVWDGDGKV